MMQGVGLRPRPMSPIEMPEGFGSHDRCQTKGIGMFGSSMDGLEGKPLRLRDFHFRFAKREVNECSYHPFDFSETCSQVWQFGLLVFGFVFV